MQISVFGTGYVGLVSGACFAELGNTVTCFDIDESKIASLKKGAALIYEPGLEELLATNLAAGRLVFTADVRQATKAAEMIFLAVGTPSSANGSADLSQLFAAAQMIAKHATRPLIVAAKSTVPVGTADRLREIFKGAKAKISVAANPEFLREGAAIKDFLNPDRVIVGVDDEALKPPFQVLYSAVARIQRPLIFMSVRSAEITKYACNAFLATKISFVNEIASLAEQVGANIAEITTGMGFDTRIGSRFLQAGVGFGGSCFPKDLRALQRTLVERGVEPTIIEAVNKVNERQKLILLTKLTALMPDLKKKTIAVWGLTFKPRTDDIRESAALTLIPLLLERGANVKAYDPKGMAAAQQVLPEQVIFTKSAKEAASRADAVMVLTEWDEFRGIDLNELTTLMSGKILLDGRNIYSHAQATKAKLIYRGVGVSAS